MKPPAEIRLYVLKRNVTHFPVYCFVAEDSALVFAFESEEAAELDLLRAAGRSVDYRRIDAPEVFDRFVVSPYGIDYIERDDLFEVLRALFERSCIFVHCFIAFVLSLWFIFFILPPCFRVVSSEDTQLLSAVERKLAQLAIKHDEEPPTSLIDIYHTRAEKLLVFTKKMLTSYEQDADRRGFRAKAYRSNVPPGFDI